MTSPSESAEGSRLRRALARIGAGLGLGIVFVGSLVGGMLLHLDLPPARRQLERFVRTALDGTFDGTVEVHGFDHVGLDGLALQEVVVHDPAGAEVLRATGVLARASVPTIARSLLGSGDLRLGLPFVRIERVDAIVQQNERGELTIATAFNPRATGAPTPGRPLYFTLAHAEIGAVHATGKPDGNQDIDADLTDIAGSVRIEPGLLAIDLVPLGVVERKVLPRPVAGVLDFHVRQRGPKDANDTRPNTTGLWATFAGKAGDVEVAASALLDDKHVEAAALIPHAAPGQVRALVPAYPVLDAVAVTAHARGDLPAIDFSLQAVTDRSGAAVAQGHVQVGKHFQADATFSTAGLDPRAVSEGAPAILVTSRGKVHAEKGSPLVLHIEAQTDPTALGPTPIPGVDAAADFDGALWQGSAKVHEPGAPTQATFATHADGAVSFDVTANAASLAAVPRIAKARLRGAASVHAAGAVRGGSLDAKLDGRVRGLRAGTSAVIDRADVRGRVHGPLSGLEVDATLHAADVVVPGYALDDAVVRVTGPVRKPVVRAHLVDVQRNAIDLGAVVDPAAQAASRVTVHLERDGVTAEGQIARVGVRGGGLAVEGVALESPQLGKIGGTLGVSGGEIVGSLKAVGVDLAAVRKVLGLPRTIEGQADVDVSLARAKGGRTGYVHVALRNAAGDVATAFFVKNVSAQLDAKFDGDRVQAAGHVAISGKGDRCGGQIAKVSLSGGDGRIEGPLLSAATWEKATGRVTVAAEDWDLSCLAEITPFSLPVSEVFGIVSAKASLEREKGQRFPSIASLTANTSYLTIVGPEPRESDEDSTTTPWSSRDLDVQLTGSVDGRSGDAKVDLSLWDDSLFATATASTTLDLDALLDPKKRAAAFETAPIAAHVTMPRRKLEALRTLPSMVRDKLPALAGEAEIDAYAAGTVQQPSAVVRVRGWGVAPAPAVAGEVNPWAMPVDVDTAASYDGRLATLDAHVAHQNTEIASADARLTVPLEKLRARDPDLARSVTGEAHVALDGVPLADLPVLGDRAVSGTLHGKASLEGLGKAPRLAVDLHTEGLRIGDDLAFPEARVSLVTRPTRAPGEQMAVASVRFADQKGGSLDAAGYVHIGWRSGLVPTLREDHPADVYANFRRFRLATVEPFLGGALRRVDGFVDGGVRVGWGHLDQTEKAAIDVDLRIADAAFYVPQLGQELRLVGDGTGPLHITADRSGTVRVERLVARGNTGRLTGSALAHLDNLRLKDAEAKFEIPENDPLPVMVEGVSLGQTWGKIAIDAKGRVAADGHTPEIAVDVRSSDLHLKIPSSSSRDVQPLDKNPDIVVLQEKQPPPAKASSKGLVLALAARLEDMVIEGDGLRVTLSSARNSPPTVVVSDKTRASGDIRLVRGYVEVMGRKFELDNGTVHLREDPSNPFLDVTAHWDAPDGSTIFVDYTGVLLPITQNKLRFRSNPPRTQQQALAMLLFGSETGGALTTGGSGDQGGNSNVVGQAAASLGGELASQQFNALLKGIAPLKGLSTKFGTTEAGGVKTSLVYQLGDTLSATATYQGGAPSGSPGGTTTSGGTSTTAPGASVSIDWRFYKNWLIRATVGTAADIPKGEVDLLWQYRY